MARFLQCHQPQSHSTPKISYCVFYIKNCVKRKLKKYFISLSIFVDFIVKDINL